jgi:hypothetical protein
LPRNWLAVPPVTRLADGLTPTGSVLAGTHTQTLRLSGVNAADTGSYDCVVSNSCGMVTSSTATLTPCIADFNCDQTAAVADIFEFLNAWFAGSPTADINGVQGINVQDIFDFLSAWFAGC